MFNLFSLEGKVALITGGSRGLGLQMAEALGLVGAKVIITARKEAELEQAITYLKSKNIEAAAIVSDLQDFDNIDRMVEEAIAIFGDIDLLINNAGASWGQSMVDHSLEGWQKVINLNITAPFLVTQSVGKRCMVPRRQGKILNIASIAGFRGNRPDLGMHTVAYNSSKAAMNNFTRELASEWGKYNINVNALCPGFFPSKMSQGLLDNIEETIVQSVPLARLGGDQDLMGPAVFLLSEASRHITGQLLAVDGGATAVQ